MGFALVVEEMIKVMRQGNCPFIGHNCMYDFIYLYNQFIGPLPDTYNEFIMLWSEHFPVIFDTKVLASKSDYIRQTTLGRVYEKCKDDKRIMDVLEFEFDLKNRFENYHGSGLLSHYHEAAYDAVMTGYAFAKMLKFKEIEELFQSNRSNKKDKKKEMFANPAQLKNTPINLSFQFARSTVNKVMLNPYLNSAVFSTIPNQLDQSAKWIEDRNSDVIWIKFHPNLRDLSADALGQMFSDFGDF